MKFIEIKAQKRTEVGRKSSKIIRKNEMIPCVMYGAGQENVHFSALETEFKPLIYTPHAYTAKLNIDGKEYEAVVKDVQYHPVSEKIEHIDFLQIFDDKKVSISVPVNLHGFPIGVKEGGKLVQLKRKVKIKAFKKDLPESVEINIDHLKIAQSIKILDLKMENVDFIDLKNTVVATIKSTRNVVEDATAPAAGGAAPAAAPEKKAAEKKK